MELNKEFELFLEVEQELSLLEAATSNIYSSDFTTPQYNALKDTFSRSTFGALDDFIAGRITADQLGDRWCAAIASAFPKAYGSGVGRWGAAIDAGDKYWLRGAIAAEQGFARNFVKDLVSGRWSINASASRLQMYVQSLDGVKNNGWLEKVPGNQVLVWWRLGSGLHCGDCEIIAANSPYLREQLNLLPRSGGTKCLSRCLCSLEIEILPNTSPIARVTDIEDFDTGIGYGRIPTEDEALEINDLRTNLNYQKRLAETIQNAEEKIAATIVAKQLVRQLDTLVSKNGLKEVAFSHLDEVITRQDITTQAVEQIFDRAFDGATLSALDVATFEAGIKAFLNATEDYLSK